MTNSQPARLSNRNGGYVEDVRVIPTAKGGHLLKFRGLAGAVTQICLCDTSYVPQGAVAAMGIQRLLSTRSELAPVTTSLIGALDRVLTLPTPPNIDFALALDRYKTPLDGVSPTKWPNSPSGGLVSRGKYLHTRPSEQEQRRACGQALVDLLAAIIDAHPLLRCVDAVAAAPGHDPKIVSFGARLANATALRIRRSFIRCSGTPDFRTSAKDLSPPELATAIKDRFGCDTDLAGQSVLIVDDVYRSGTTLAETARALRQSGATLVAALCPVRTMRTG